MIYYFSGAYRQDLKRELNIPQLFSQFNERRLIEKTIEYKKEHPEYTAPIFVDSGAFTAYTKGVKIDIDDYIEFINRTGDYIEVFAELDDVPDPANMDFDKAETSWKNYLYMIDHVKPEYRDKIIPVFHYGEDFKWLRNMLEYKHPDGKHIDYIGLAISLEGTTKVRISWANECRRIINESSNPNVKTHAFGVGVKSVLDHIDVTSTDATSWVKRAAFGMIGVNDRSIYVSDVHREKCDGKHLAFESKALQEDVIKIIESRGFTLEELETNPYQRAKFNILDTIDWVSKLNKDKTLLVKNDLGW